ncbi:MAG: ParB/RepB/Spo0J family partition protein, partial [Chloroflexota bacterium]|nr:ParB/RepB/Spo0J family partition protein [Chloroflexota bacterium]
MSRARRDMATALLDRGPSAPQPEIAQPASERFMPGAKIVALSLIKPNPRQPRKWFDPDALGELAESIRDRGVMQPLVVRPLPEGYGIVVGERRYRAATLAGLAEVPVIVRDTGEEQAYIDALVENLQRSNLTDEEEAEAYRGLMGQGYSARGIAERLKIDISKVSRLTRVFGDPTLAAAVGDGQITKSQAQELLVVPEEEKPRLVQFVATRRKQSQPVSLQELRGEIKK